MSSNPPLLLQQVVAAIDSSSNPSDAFSGMMVYLMTSLDSMSIDDVEEAVCHAFGVIDERMFAGLDSDARFVKRAAKGAER